MLLTNLVSLALSASSIAQVFSQTITGTASDVYGTGVDTYYANIIINQGNQDPYTHMYSSDPDVPIDTFSCQYVSSTNFASPPPCNVVQDSDSLV